MSAKPRVKISVKIPVQLLGALLLSLPALPSLAQAPPDEATPGFQASEALTMELKNARWFDGERFRQGTLYVDQGRFVAKRPKRLQRRMNLREQYLVPPLAEAHNHNLQNPWGFERFTQRYIEHGVFYAAMLCSDPPSVAPLRARAARPDTPDISFVTACITSSDGHPLGMLLDSQDPAAPALRFEDVADKAVLVMDTPDDVARKWPLIAPRQTRWVKLVLSYHERPALRQDPANKGRLGVSAEVARAVVARAHADGLKVTAHIDSAADFAAAVDAGVDQIAHLPGYFFHHGLAAEDYLISAETAARAARQRVQVVTTTAASALFPVSEAQREAVRSTQQRNLRTLLEAGVPLLLGSDVFMDTSLAEYRSLQALAVLEPARLLRMATRDTASALFPERRLGCFEPGCEASFLLLGQDPLSEPEALGRPLLRVKNGRILQPAAP